MLKLLLQLKMRLLHLSELSLQILPLTISVSTNLTNSLQEAKHDERKEIEREHSKEVNHEKTE